MSWAAHAKEELRAGNSVVINPRGNSMTPTVKSGATVSLAPVIKETKLEVGSIVLVHVGGRDFLHLISAIRTDNIGEKYQISNRKGHINGWVNRASIYGIATRIDN